MKSTLFSTLLIILFIQTILLSVNAQQSSPAIPPKCCNPMHMPVNGKCEEVQCRNDNQCAEKFQPYCTKYNTGQSMCRGLSGVCGCNRERSTMDKYPTGLNCPANESCLANGKCGPKEGPKCANPDHVPKGGECQRVPCRNDAQCGTYEPYCTKYKIGTPLCRGMSGICGCNGERSSVDINAANAPKSCNRNLNGNDKCATGQICFPDGHCGPHPGCEFHGSKCDPKKKTPCCGGTYCHQRRLSSDFSCVYNAFVRESCASGIPCEEGASCINGTCSLRGDDSCDFDGAVCPPGTKCQHVPIDQGTNKMCIRNS